MKYGDKIPEDKKTAINSALEKLKEAHKNQNLEAIDAATEELNTAWQAASQDIYQAQQQAGQQPGSDPQQGQPNPEEGAQDSGNDDEVTDVDFEEVKDDK